MEQADSGEHRDGACTTHAAQRQHVAGFSAIKPAASDASCSGYSGAVEMARVCETLNFTSAARVSQPYWPSFHLI